MAIRLRPSRLLKVSISAVFGLAILAVVLTALQVADSAAAGWRWPAAAVVLAILVWRWRATLARDWAPFRQIEHREDLTWRLWQNGQTLSFDARLRQWSEAGPFVALEFEPGQHHLLRRRLLIARDQCPEPDWRELQRSLRWSVVRSR